MSQGDPCTLHVFASVKGGVGKSTLALLAAHLLAEAGRTAVVIDADLTGTSLADGLALEAPILPEGEDGTLDLSIPVMEPRKFYPVEESRRRRIRRWTARDQTPRFLPFLNDALSCPGGDHELACRVETMLWRQGAPQAGRQGVIHYLPSSPTRRDVAFALGWLYLVDDPLRWLRQMCWVLDALFSRVSGLRHVVLDLPPGLFGFAHEILLLLQALSEQQPLPPGYPDWTQRPVRLNPFLVTSQDSNDLFVALEYYREARAYVHELIPLINRRTERIEDIRQRVASHFLGEDLYAGIEDHLSEGIDELRLSLGRIFVDGQLRLSKETAAQADALRIPR